MQTHSASEPLPTFPQFSHSASPQILAAWDATLQSLWAAETEASRAAAHLYASETPGSELTARESETILLFRRELEAHAPQLPLTSEGRYQAVAVALWYPLHQVRENPSLPFIEDALAVALRPVRALQVSALTAEICMAVYDYHRGVWTPHLTRPQRQKIQTVLAAALSALPPDEIEVFWENLHSENALMRGAMRLGLDWLTSDHAVPHLLCGLERSADSDTRFAIVDNLARIGDPAALPRLYTLRRSAALTDWPLARRVSATIGVIEHLNRGRKSLRSLLRPAQAPAPDPSGLLRPTTESDPSPTTLLHPSDPSSL